MCYESRCQSRVKKRYVNRSVVLQQLFTRTFQFVQFNLILVTDQTLLVENSKKHVKINFVKQMCEKLLKSWHRQYFRWFFLICCVHIILVRLNELCGLTRVMSRPGWALKEDLWGAASQVLLPQSKLHTSFITAFHNMSTLMINLKKYKYNLIGKKYCVIFLGVLCDMYTNI